MELLYPTKYPMLANENLSVKKGLHLLSCWLMSHRPHTLQAIYNASLLIPQTIK